MRRLLCAFALVAASVGAACSPSGEGAGDVASASADLTATELEGARWVGDGTSFAWLEVARDGTYRAGRRSPFRNEAGTVTVRGNELALVRGHVTERFTASVRGDTLTLTPTAGKAAAKIVLRKTTPTPPPSVQAKAPFVPLNPVRASNGKIYATGPTVALVTPFASYDPATKAWTELAPVPTLLESPPTVAGDDGRIYFLGGNDSSVLRNLTGAAPFVHAYDTRTDFWIDLPPIAPSESRAFAGAGLCPGGRIALFGGMRFNGAGISTPSYSYFRKPLLYDVRTGRSTYGADSGVALVNPTVASSPRGIVYVVGGVLYGSGEVGADTPRSNSSSFALAYDCARDAWKTLPMMPTPRVDAGAFVDERGRLWVVGGSDGGGAYKPVSYKTVEMYDPATNAWTTVKDGVYAYRPGIVPGDGVFWLVSAGSIDPLGPFGGG